ncbi:MAG: bacteriocin [Oscillospiraceae bacterium]|mgnify:CR=1 FL=1|nr:bacteriocin [Candidatus Limimonas egerieequi]MCQ2461752.1 bacteriocin [Clostridia bacterium]
MKELNEKELNEVNGGVDPAGSDLNGWQDFLKKIGKGIKNITKPVLKSGPAPVAATSPEEELGGKIIVTPTDESLKP